MLAQILGGALGGGCEGKSAHVNGALDSPASMKYLDLSNRLSAFSIPSCQVLVLSYQKSTLACFCGSERLMCGYIKIPSYVSASHSGDQMMGGVWGDEVAGTVGVSTRT